MQAHDNSLTTLTRRSPFGRFMTSRQGTGAPNPSWIPEGHEAVRRMADKMGDDGVEGIAGGTIGDPFNIPLTAHILGGCAIGSDAADAASSTRTCGCSATRACTSWTARP